MKLKRTSLAQSRSLFLCVSVTLGLMLGLTWDAHAESFTQWAVEAEVSSQYQSTNYSAKQLTGAPDAYPKYGDARTAWAAASANAGQEWLVLTYAQPVVVEYVDIYETYNPGAVTKVGLIDEFGLTHLIWQGEAAAATKEARILRVRNDQVDLPVNKVHIILDTKKVPDWNEIDAVSITGHRPTKDMSHYLGQWAISATGSSQYGTDSYSARQATGVPNSYPAHGDAKSAWAPSSANAGEEWLELTYGQEVMVQRVDIYETYNAGALAKVELIDGAGNRHLMWQGDPGPIDSPRARIFQVQNQRVQVPSQKVRLTFNTSKVPGWNEIDAVGLLGTRVAGRRPGAKGFAIGPSTQAGPAYGADQRPTSDYGSDPLADLDAILERLEDAIARAKAGQSAHPDFLADLEQMLEVFYSISDDLHSEEGGAAPAWQWGSY